MKTDHFVNDNWMPYPSEKFKNYNEYIKAYQKFLKTGVFPILFLILSILFQSCTNIKDPKISITKAPQIQKTPFESYHENSSILCDSNDTILNHLDTVLLFSDNKIFYEVKINKIAVKIVASKWSELPDNKSLYTDIGYQKDGFVYTKGKRDSTYNISYKILLGKGLFIWDGQNWKLVNAGGD